MFNTFLQFIQSKTEFIYRNSVILQNLDKLILISILAVFIFSTFAQSDFIGVFAFIAIVLTFLNLLLKKGASINCNKFELFLLAYFMFVVVSLFGSTLFALSFHGFLKIVMYLGFYLSVVQYLKYNRQNVWLIIYVIAACVCYEVLQGLVQSFVRPSEISTWQDTSYLNPEDIMSRVYGTLKPLNPNLMGGYLVATIPMLFAVLANTFYKKNNIVAILLCGFSILAIYVLFATGCRGSYLGLVAIFIALALVSAKFFWKKYKELYIKIVSSLVTLATLFVLSVSSLRARIFSIFAMRTDSSNSFRFNVYQSCLDMFKDNWLLGIGLGNQNFREVYGLYMKTGFDALSAYNIYLETAVESGLFALISFLGFLSLVIYSAYKFIKTSTNIESLILVIAAVISIIGLMVHGFVDTVFFRPQIHFVFWTAVAIIRVETNENINS